MKNGIRLLNRAMASTAGLRLMVVGMTALADLLFYRQPSGWPLGLFLLLAGLLLAENDYAPQDWGDPGKNHQTVNFWND